MPNLSKADQAAKISTTEARRRQVLALAELREMERDERRRLLIPADQVRSAWLKVLAMVKAAALRIPDKCAPNVAAVSDPRACRTILLAEVETILDKLANDVHGLAEGSTARRSRRSATPQTSVSRGVGKRKLPS